MATYSIHHSLYNLEMCLSFTLAEVYFTTADHVKLHGWFIPAAKSSVGPTLLFCHEVIAHEYLLIKARMCFVIH